jgi:HK97 family phage major capsid protein
MPNAERRIANIMSAAVAAGLDHAFVNGSGVAQPTGILNSPALVSITKESGQSGTLLLQNLVKAVGRLHPRSYRNATWLVHPTCVPSLLAMTTTILNLAGSENVGGSHSPAVTFAADGTMRIFGRPAVVTDACAPLGTVGDCILADLSRYLIAIRREATLQTSIHANWQQDLFAMRLILRLNGCTEDNAPTTLRDGSNTVSPFVAIETR